MKVSISQALPVQILLLRVKFGANLETKQQTGHQSHNQVGQIKTEAKQVYYKILQNQNYNFVIFHEIGYNIKNRRTDSLNGNGIDFHSNSTWKITNQGNNQSQTFHSCCEPTPFNILNGDAAASKSNKPKTSLDVDII